MHGIKHGRQIHKKNALHKKKKKIKKKKRKKKKRKNIIVTCWHILFLCLQTNFSQNDQFQVSTFFNFGY
jgi:hypothetical protein